MEQRHQHETERYQHHAMKASDINTTVSYKGKEHILSVHLEDPNGKAPELNATHEKLMHLIVVSEDLNEYYHLHPIQKNASTFESNIDLTGHLYRSFVDINPKGKTYIIEPIPFEVGSASQMHYKDMNPVLQIDKESTKEIGEKKVEFKPDDPLQVGKDIKLTFNIENAMPEPYLGALGHVVIIDDKVQEFIHVHPISDDETVFEAHFSKPGIYKLWAEFKIDGEVFTFPYVIEVKKER